MYELDIDTKIEGAEPNQPLHKADAGMDIVVTVKSDGSAVDISGASTMKYRLEDPSGDTKDVTASFNGDGTDGKLKITTATGTFDDNGDWYLQVYFTLSGNVQYTEKKVFTVFRNLTAPSS